jgi:ribosome-binding protein aMBF1 (putative translation factor)
VQEADWAKEEAPFRWYVKSVDSWSVVVHDVCTIPMDEKRKVRIQQQFGKRVRELRRQKGLSQESLAFICDLDRTYVGGVERGERNISLVNIYKIAAALGVKPRELF